MPDWLFEGRTAIYVLLAAVAFLALCAWWQTRRRVALITLAFALGLGGLYFLLDRLVETDREQIERKVRLMAAAVQAHSTDSIFSHISESFQRGGTGREAFRSFTENALRNSWVNEIEVWGFEFGDDFRSSSQVPIGATTRQAEVAQVSFMVKPKGGRLPHEPFLRCDARFVRDADGQWRLLGFDLFEPAVNTQRPIDINLGS